jgi:hypothetical protein
MDTGHNCDRYRLLTHKSTPKVTRACKSKIAISLNRNERCSIARMKI